MQAVDEIARQAFGFFESPETSVLRVHQPAARRAEPKSAIFIRRDGAHIAERLARNLVEQFQFSVLITHRARRRSNPKFVAPKQKRRHRHAKIFRPWRKIKRLILLNVQSAAPRAGPDLALPVCGERPDVGMTK